MRHCKVPYPLDTYAVSVQCFSVDVEVMISALMLSLFEPAPEREIDPLWDACVVGSFSGRSPKLRLLSLSGQGVFII